MAKNIALCFNGTWNIRLDPVTHKPSDAASEDDAKENSANTNVAKIAAMIDASAPDQVVKYFDGVGTDWYDHISGGGAGIGLDARIKEGYQALVETFDPGDNIYIFGFSRGAYTARSLGGMVRKCGVVRRECMKNTDAAFDLYRKRDATPDSDEAVAFRKSFSNTTKIQFMGVWDTVGELGIPLAAFKIINKDVFGFHDTSLSVIIKNGYHAVAIDENRKEFAPTLWTGQPAPDQTIEQRWFCGAHSNVGGGYEDDHLSNIALEWMCKKAAACGLRFKNTPPFEASPDDYKGGIHDSYGEFMGACSWFYKLFHPRYWRTIGFGTCCQKLDQSVLNRLLNVADYKPNNIRRWGDSNDLTQYL